MSPPTSDSVAPISVEAIAFDLLSALLDSPTLWERMTIPPQLGRTWHFITLQTIASTGAYTPYVDILHQTATELDVPPQAVNRLLKAGHRSSRGSTRTGSWPGWPDAG